MIEVKQYMIALGYTLLIVLGFVALFAIMPTPHWLSEVLR